MALGLGTKVEHSGPTGMVLVQRLQTFSRFYDVLTLLFESFYIYNKNEDQQIPRAAC